MDYPLRKRYSPKLPNIETIKTPIRVKSEKILPQASLSSFKNNTDRPSTQSKTHKYTLSYENTERHLGKTPSILLPTRVESLNIFSKHVKVSEPLIKSSSFNSPYLKTKLEIVMTLRELIHTHDSDLTITRLKTILKALEILANEEGKYQGEMLFMVDEIKKTLYIHKEKIDPKILEIVYERHIDALTDQDGYIPYIYLYYIILEINQKLNQNESNLKNDNENSKVKYEQEIDALKLKISELQGTANGKTEGTLN